MEKIEEFKSFVKTKPELISYVRNGEMTWQKFYELWFLYGPDSEEWNRYSNKDVKSSTKSNFSLSDLFNNLKKVDMDSVRTNIAGIQKAIGLVQEIISKDTKLDNAGTKDTYKPRPIYRRFED
ncbi:MAG: spore coat protein YlbD [Bacilli bacterium]|nr:spore coat protein YlbD [Bacilli bacterium]MDD4643916.1 spore coat protein YlbD [Bacilli bacterium]